MIVHPDFIRNYPLEKKIAAYGYFSYAVNEALYLSEKEEAMIETIMKNIEQEYRSVIDTYSQDVIVSHIELLLNYANRFYNRQFITRKNAGNHLLENVEELLTEYFNGSKVSEKGVPTVQYISEKLNISPNYLSDMLRLLTGQSTQQHIHNKLIEKAKEILTTTSLSVSEIAYGLGFEYPQSFSKVGLMVWSPLAGGLLSGKYKRDRTEEEKGRWTTSDFQPVDKNKAFNILDVLQTMANEKGASVAQLALAWLLHQPVVTTAIIGATKRSQLEDNIKSVEVKLSESELQQLNEVSKFTLEYPGAVVEAMSGDRKRE